MIQIDVDVLVTYGATFHKISKGDFAFREKGHPHFFFQLIHGEIKMFTINRQGKEMIQGIFHSGEGFGEPPLFINKRYPSSAIAMKDSTIVKLSRERLFELIAENPTIGLSLIQGFSERIYKKIGIIQILGSNNPEDKILTFLDQYKEHIGSSEMIKIPFTRQQIADSTGLCVETVIRTLRKLNEEDVVDIIKHKVHY